MPAAPVRPPEYRRRKPEKEPLYQILAWHLETFLQQAGTAEHRLPLQVEKEMRAYLECGILAYGFVRARCEDCGASRAVAFSCKKRGFCPSCCGRRMADTAARLVDDVLPRVPVRQWVLSFRYEIRYRLAYDGEWVSAVLAVFLRVVGRWYRHQAQALGHDRTRWGSVTFVQRFGSSLNLNPHVHVLMLDGVYVDGEDAPVFVPAPPLSDQAVQQIVETSSRRIIRLCTKHGLLDDTAADPLTDEEPVLAALTAASVRGITATGERAGQRLRRVLKDPATGVRTAPLCFASRGFSLHAATRIAGPDRRGVERLCRYVARPALAGGRLRIVNADHLSFALKTPWSDGPAISCCLRWNCWRNWRLWFPRPGFISCATTGSWRPGPATATASCRPSRLPSRRLRTAIRDPSPAAIAWGGRPCWGGCFLPTSANARPVAVA